jgi:predicted metal-dependent phosphoesterase TrpH
MAVEYQDVIEINSMTSQERSIGRPHIAHTLVKKGYVSTIQEAFNKYLGDERPCYVQGDSFTVDETIDVIHQANGIAVIAHPHLIKNTALLNQLLQKDIDGIECYYGRFLSEAHQRWIKIAKHRNLLITGGSDFHGTVKPNLNLGSSWIDQDLFQAILDRLKANHS